MGRKNRLCHRIACVIEDKSEIRLPLLLLINIECRWSDRFKRKRSLTPQCNNVYLNSRKALGISFDFSLNIVLLSYI